MMKDEEREDAMMMRDRLKEILLELKIVYTHAKNLEDVFGWEFDSRKVCEAYMNLSHEYIGVINALEEEEKGGEK